MNVAQFAHHFKFNNDCVIDQQIGCVVSNRDIVILNHDSGLLGYAKTSLANLMRQSVLVDLFQKPNAQRIGYGQ